MNKKRTGPTRDWTQFHLDAIFNRAGGRIIWQPRILAWYDDRIFDGRPLPEPYVGLSRPDLYRALDCSNRIYEYNECFKSHEDPRVDVKQRDISDTDYEIIWHTPVGSQKAVFHRAKETSWHEPVKWPIVTEADMKVAAWREERRTYTWDQPTFDRISHEWAGLGAPTVFICRTNVQKLFIEDMGVEAGVFAVLDWPAACERYFEALAVIQERLITAINASPIPIVNFGDNFDATVLPPDWFKKYVLPVYQRRCELLHTAGKFVHSHWDGACKSLLPLAKDTGLDGIEAITPLPQGDVTLEETKAALGDMTLLDGIPAVYFDHTFSEQTLIDCTRKCIDLFAPNLILGISDEMSAQGDIERVRLVGQIVDEYNASLS